LATEEAAKERLAASQRLANPLAGLSRERLAAMGEDYARLAGLTSDEDMRAFRLGAMIAGDNTRYDTIPELTDREREVLERETTHKWSNPSMLYWVIVSRCPLPPEVHVTAAANALYSLLSVCRRPGNG
jgi:hypothetical protein